MRIADIGSVSTTNVHRAHGGGSSGVRVSHHPSSKTSKESPRTSSFSSTSSFVTSSLPYVRYFQCLLFGCVVFIGMLIFIWTNLPSDLAFSDGDTVVSMMEREEGGWLLGGVRKFSKIASTKESILMIPPSSVLHARVDRLLEATLSGKMERLLGELAKSVEFQGKNFNFTTGEQPGKIHFERIEETTLIKRMLQSSSSRSTEEMDKMGKKGRGGIGEGGGSSDRWTSIYSSVDTTASFISAAYECYVLLGISGKEETELAAEGKKNPETISIEAEKGKKAVLPKNMSPLQKDFLLWMIPHVRQASTWIRSHIASNQEGNLATKSDQEMVEGNREGKSRDTEAEENQKRSTLNFRYHNWVRPYLGKARSWLSAYVSRLTRSNRYTFFVDSTHTLQFPLNADGTHKVLKNHPVMVSTVSHVKNMQGLYHAEQLLRIYYDKIRQWDAPPSTVSPEKVSAESREEKGRGRGVRMSNNDGRGKDNKQGTKENVKGAESAVGRQEGGVSSPFLSPSSKGSDKSSRHRKLSSKYEDAEGEEERRIIAEEVRHLRRTWQAMFDSLLDYLYDTETCAFRKSLVENPNRMKKSSKSPNRQGSSRGSGNNGDTTALRYSEGIAAVYGDLYAEAMRRTINHDSLTITSLGVLYYLPPFYREKDILALLPFIRKSLAGLLTPVGYLNSFPKGLTLRASPRLKVDLLNQIFVHAAAVRWGMVEVVQAVQETVVPVVRKAVMAAARRTTASSRGGRDENGGLILPRGLKLKAKIIEELFGGWMPSNDQQQLEKTVRNSSEEDWEVTRKSDRLRSEAIRNYWAIFLGTTTPSDAVDWWTKSQITCLMSQHSLPFLTARTIYCQPERYRVVTSSSSSRFGEEERRNSNREESKMFSMGLRCDLPPLHLPLSFSDLRKEVGLGSGKEESSLVVEIPERKLSVSSMKDEDKDGSTTDKTRIDQRRLGEMMNEGVQKLPNMGFEMREGGEREGEEHWERARHGGEDDYDDYYEDEDDYYNEEDENDKNADDLRAPDLLGDDLWEEEEMDDDDGSYMDDEDEAQEEGGQEMSDEANIVDPPQLPNFAVRPKDGEGKSGRQIFYEDGKSRGPGEGKAAYRVVDIDGKEIEDGYNYVDGKEMNYGYNYINGKVNTLSVVEVVDHTENFNDDFCDCENTGVDEPFTNVCAVWPSPSTEEMNTTSPMEGKKENTNTAKSGRKHYTKEEGETARMMFWCAPSNEWMSQSCVGDGIVDCCDGSDETISEAAKYWSKRRAEDEEAKREGGIARGASEESYVIHVFNLWVNAVEKKKNSPEDQRRMCSQLQW